MKKNIFIVGIVSSFLILSLILSNTSLTQGKKHFEIECVQQSGVVDKAPGEEFTVKITFRNTGKTVGSWNINIAFEGENWSWAGVAQHLTLKPHHKGTLTWKGEVPENAPARSIARLIVYFNGKFVRLDWWIHVTEAAELSIVSSTVK